VIVSNTGGNELKVKRMQIRLRRDQDAEFVLPAKNYLQEPSDKEAVLFTSFKLKPTQEWAHIVNFLKFFPREDEKELRRLDSTMRLDLLAKREALVDKHEEVEAEAAIIVAVVAFHNRYFRWFAGEYVLTLEVDVEPQRACFAKQYRFTLFESDSQDLSDHKNDYKYGYGVCLSSRQVGVAVPLTEV
jgi:hypothetical protein